MKKQPLWEISVTVSPEAEEAVVELLGRVFKSAAVVYENRKTGITKVSVYCPLVGTPRRGVRYQAESPPPDRAASGYGVHALACPLPELPSQKWAALLDGLKTIKANGLAKGLGKVQVRRVKREDWAESWKRHFKPIEIGTQLLVKPSWIKRKPLKHQAVVVLDPGLSFGTGNHPTTEFCLRELVKARKPGTRQSFWDVGTGSGILAIAAAKLGYFPVRAMDFDPESVRIARENARKNGVLQKVQITRADITKLASASAKKFDVICANLISNLLIAERSRLANRLHANGRLVLAGILCEEFVEVQRAYEKLGLELIRCRVGKEWRSGMFKSSKLEV